MFYFIFGLFPSVIIPFLHINGILFVDDIAKTIVWYILLFISYILNIAHSEQYSINVIINRWSKLVISICLMTQITLSFLYSFSTPFIFWEYVYNPEYNFIFLTIFILEYIMRYYLILKS